MMKSGAVEFGFQLSSGRAASCKFFRTLSGAHYFTVLRLLHTDRFSPSNGYDFSSSSSTYRITHDRMRAVVERVGMGSVVVVGRRCSAFIRSLRPTRYSYLHTAAAQKVTCATHVDGLIEKIPVLQRQQGTNATAYRPRITSSVN